MYDDKSKGYKLSEDETSGETGKEHLSVHVELPIMQADGSGFHLLSAKIYMVNHLSSLLISSQPRALTRDTAAPNIY